MPRANKGPRLVLYGPDNRFGATVRRGFSRYRWYIAWYEQGRRREHGTGVEHGGDAEGAFRAWLDSRAAAQRPAGSPSDPSEMTVAQALHWYGQEHAPNTRAPQRIAYSIETLAPLLGPMPLQKVTANVRRRYVRDRQAAGRSVATARKELGTLDAAARHCVREGYLTHYPDDQWLPDSAPPRELWLSESDVARLLWKARKDPRCRLHLPLFILTAVYTGRRREAILSLQWQPNMDGGWVDLERGIIDFRRAGQAETKKKRGAIPIPRRLLTFLRFARRRTRQFVFEFRGEPVKNVKMSLATAGKNAGLGHVHAHLLKHTAVTWLARRGVPMEDVSLYTETTVETLRRVYRQYSPDMHSAVLKAFR